MANCNVNTIVSAAVMALSADVTLRRSCREHIDGDVTFDVRDDIIVLLRIRPASARKSSEASR